LKKAKTFRRKGNSNC